MDIKDLSLRELMNCGKLYEEYLPLNQGAEVGVGSQIQLVGLVKTKEQEVQLVVLGNGEHKEYDEYSVRKKIKTRRQEMMQDVGRLEEERFQNNLSSCFIDRVQIGEKIYQVSCNSVSVIGAEEIFFLRNCLEQGWSPETMTDWAFDLVDLCSLTLDGEWGKISEDFCSSQKIAIAVKPKNRKVPTQKRMTLPITTPDDELKARKYLLPHENFQFWIDRVYLYDIWEKLDEVFEEPKLIEKYSRAERREMRLEQEKWMQKLCPKGKYLPIIEYESVDGRQLDFFDSTYLSEEPRSSNSSITLAVLDEKKTGKQGYPVRLHALQTPVDADCVKVSVELLFYWEPEKEEIIVEF